MTRALIAVLLAASLTACVHRYDIHCDLVDGVWSCKGGAEGGKPPLDTPGI